jgi:hypothetical protein
MRLDPAERQIVSDALVDVRPLLANDPTGEQSRNFPQLLEAILNAREEDFGDRESERIAACLELWLRNSDAMNAAPERTLTIKLLLELHLGGVQDRVLVSPLIRSRPSGIAGPL